jgi:hypothetical protein
MAEDEDGVEEESEHERPPPLRQISKNIVQTARGQASGSSATAKGRKTVRGRIRERAKRSLHERSLGPVFCSVLDCKGYKFCITLRNMYSAQMRTLSFVTKLVVE